MKKAVDVLVIALVGVPLGPRRRKKSARSSIGVPAQSSTPGPETRMRTLASSVHTLALTERRCCRRSEGLLDVT